MKWQDILKSVTTQGKIKEIEDIDIDIEDDDCLRWLKKLFDMSGDDETKSSWIFDIKSEADACAIKEGFISLKKENANKKVTPATNTTSELRGFMYTKVEGANSFYTAFIKGEYPSMVLFSQYVANTESDFSNFLVSKSFDSVDEFKRIVKRVCSHLGFNAQEIFETVGV
tara:strand:- start:4731 stop:5240 length:510 start_codon:yes stop_codon:yes gene_type:complete